jgi:hypothetical protein
VQKLTTGYVEKVIAYKHYIINLHQKHDYFSAAKINYKHDAHFSDDELGKISHI